MKELFDFLHKHRYFYKVHSWTVRETNGNFIDKIVFESTENILGVDSFIKCSKKIKKLTSSTNHFFDCQLTTTLYEGTIYNKVENAMNKENSTNDDLNEFFQHHFLVNNVTRRTRCPKNYNDLHTRIYKRMEDYCAYKVSPARINEFSFKFHGSIEDYENQSACGICFEDYKVDQEVCHLPCDHFYCKACVEKWFKEREDIKFQCPSCRGDCT